MIDLAAMFSDLKRRLALSQEQEIPAFPGTSSSPGTTDPIGCKGFSGISGNSSCTDERVVASSGICSVASTGAHSLVQGVGANEPENLEAPEYPLATSS